MDKMILCDFNGYSLQELLRIRDNLQSLKESGFLDEFEVVLQRFEDLKAEIARRIP